MNQYIAHVALVVNDYDEALEFYVEKLGFLIIEDKKLDEHKRWILISPPGEGTCNLLLAKASGETQVKSIGNQTGGRVFLFLHTDNFGRDYTTMKNNGVHFLEEPRSEVYGRVVVFEDLYGNKWDLIESRK